MDFFVLYKKKEPGEKRRQDSTLRKTFHTKRRVPTHWHIYQSSKKYDNYALDEIRGNRRAISGLFLLP